LKTTVYSRTDKRAEQDVGNSDKFVDSILSSNIWADRAHEPRVGIVLVVLCRLQTEELARVVGDSRVYSE